jgi:hypothetical protein
MSAKFGLGEKSMEFPSQCRQYRADTTQPPTSLVNCHCGLCHQLSGAAYSTWVTVRADSFSILRSDGIRRYRPTDNIARAFCKTCGTHVFTEDRRLPGAIGIPAGIIRGVILPEPAAHYFVDDKAAWHSIHDAVPCFGGANGMTPLP